MASNAASSVQFRVNGTEMARERTRKTERRRSADPRFGGVDAGELPNSYCVNDRTAGPVLGGKRHRRRQGTQRKSVRIWRREGGCVCREFQNHIENAKIERSTCSRSDLEKFCHEVQRSPTKPTAAQKRLIITEN